MSSTRTASNTTAPTQFLQANGHSYAYRRFGNGSGLPLLCLQHFTGTLDNWDPAVTDPLGVQPETTLRGAVVVAVAVPVAVFLGLMHVLSYYLVRRFYLFQAWLLIATASVVAVTLVAALSGVDVARCLVTLMLAPAVTVVGSEVQAAETRS